MVSANNLFPKQAGRRSRPEDRNRDRDHERKRTRTRSRSRSNDRGRPRRSSPEFQPQRSKRNDKKYDSRDGKDHSKSPKGTIY